MHILIHLDCLMHNMYNRPSALHNLTITYYMHAVMVLRMCLYMYSAAELEK